MSADRVAVRLRRRRAPVLEALRTHPLIVHNGRPRRASRYRLIVNPASDYQPRGGSWFTIPDHRQPDAPEGGRIVVVCPECGAHRAVPQYEARKIERGARSGRCGPCSEAWQERRSTPKLTPTERARYRRWWLATFTDEELARIATGLGVAASPEGFARVRTAEETPTRPPA